METKYITIKKCLIMLIFLLLAIFICKITESSEDTRLSTALLINDETSKTVSVASEIKP